MLRPKIETDWLALRLVVFEGPVSILGPQIRLRLFVIFFDLSSKSSSIVILTFDAG
jgi:hypothetical protein